MLTNSYLTIAQPIAVLLAFLLPLIIPLPTCQLPCKQRQLTFPKLASILNYLAYQTDSRQKQMTILFVGRLVPYKLPEVVVRAFAASPILQQHKLVIVGEGPESPRLERLLRKTI
jgi:glycosyltransferase involved in cell wall biosynthesis